MVEKVINQQLSLLLGIMQWWYAFFLLTVAATEQENDEHESLVSDEKPTLEPFEGKSMLFNVVYIATCTNESIILWFYYYTLCVADETDTAPVDSDREIVTVAIIEEDDEHDETILAWRALKR